VRAFAAEEKETEMFYEEIERSAELYEKLGFGIGFFQAGTNLLLNGILLSTLYFGGQLLSTGSLSPGDLMAFLMAAQTIQKSLGQLSVLFGTYVRGQSAGARVFQVMLILDYAILFIVQFQKLEIIIIHFFFLVFRYASLTDDDWR